MKSSIKKTVLISASSALLVGLLLPILGDAQSPPPTPTLNSPVIIYDDLEIVANTTESGNLYVKGGAAGGLFAEHGLTVGGSLNVGVGSSQNLRLTGGLQMNGTLSAATDVIILRNVDVSAPRPSSPRAAFEIGSGTITVNNRRVDIAALSGGTPSDRGTVSIVSGQPSPNVGPDQWENSLAMCPPRGKLISCDMAVSPQDFLVENNNVQFVTNTVRDRVTNDLTGCSVYARNSAGGRAFIVTAQAVCFVQN